MNTASTESNKKDIPKQVLHFVLKNVYACIDLQDIQQVIPLPLLEPIPGAESYYAGLMNFAGDGVPVIDLALRLDIHRNHPYSLYMPVLLCTSNDHKVGIVVDEIIGLADVKPEDYQRHDEFNTTDSPFLATILLNKQLSLLINIEHILPDNLGHVISKLDKKMLKETNHHGK